MKKIAVYALLLMLFARCNDDNDFAKIDCSNIACTEIFIAHFVTIKDPSGVAVPLDSFTVTDLNSGEDLTRELAKEDFENARQAGSYPLYDDLTEGGAVMVDRCVLFKGFIDGEEVIRSAYEVGMGCCHSSVAKGNLNLILE